ncbi:MAG: hypothetical protein Tsb0016_09500 [Sphingomonadales bacterium]
MSEGNFSVQQARALAERDISTVHGDGQATSPDASGATDHSTADDPQQVENAAQFNPARRLWPVFAATAASLIWLAGAAAASYWAWMQDWITAVTPADIAAAVAGLMTPIVCVWVMALVFQRTDPLLERRLALARTLNRAIAPIDAAEIKLNQLLARLNRDVDTVERTVELAAERIDTLEARFQSQVSDLFSATADAEARAANIRDLLRRERDALDGMVTNLDMRARDVEAAMTAVAARVEEADQTAQRAAAQIGARLDAERLQLGQTMDGAAAQFSAISDDLAARAAALERAALDAEALLSARLAGLDDGQEQYRATLEHLAARAESLRMAVARDMKALADLTENSDTKVQALAETMADTIARLRAATDAATQDSLSAAQKLADTTGTLDAQTDQTAHRLQATATALEERLRQALTDAEAMLSRTEHTLDAQVEQITGKSGEAANLLAEKLDMLERVATLAASQLQDAIGHASQDAGTKLAAERRALSDTADSLVTNAEQAAARVGAQMGTLSDGLRGQLDGLTAMARDNRQEIDALSALLADRIEALSGLTGQAQRDLAAAGDAIAAQTEASSENFARLDDQFTGLQQQLDARREALMAMGTDVTTRLNTAMQELGAQAARIGEDVNNQAEGLGTENERLAGQLAMMRDRFAEAMRDSEGAIAAFRQASEDLGQLAANNVGQLDEATAKLTGLGNQSEQIQAAVADMARGMTQEIDKIRAAVRDAGEAADQGAVQVGATYLSAMARSRKISADAVEAARTAAENVVRMVEDTVGKTLETLRNQGDAQSAEAEQAITATAERIAKSLGDTLGQVGMAASRASVTAESAARRVASQAEGLLKETHDLASKMSAMEARLDTVVRSDLVRTSSLIIEGLNAAAVDIGRVLAADITDQQWQQYLAGDKSLFTRQTLKLGDKASRKKIAKRFDEDSDFRDHVTRFLRDFELLMARALAGKQTTPLSIALLSSDLGKLYVLLAQSVKRLN